MSAGQKPEPKVLFEDITFTVKDHGGKLGVEIAFAGLDCGEDVSGSKWFVDAAAEQVREICSRRSTALPDRLSKLSGIERAWQTLDIGHTQWRRQGADFMVHVTRTRGDDGSDEWWVQTRDDNGIPYGPEETGGVYDIEGARDVGSRLSNMIDWKAPTP